MEQPGIALDLQTHEPAPWFSEPVSHLAAVL
jgi:hypothetical protein